MPKEYELTEAEAELAWQIVTMRLCEGNHRLGAPRRVSGGRRSQMDDAKLTEADVSAEYAIVAETLILIRRVHERLRATELSGQYESVLKTEVEYRLRVRR